MDSQDKTCCTTNFSGSKQALLVKQSFAANDTRNGKGPRDWTAVEPELVEAATMFVEEIIEKAKVEAAMKLKFDKMVSCQDKNTFISIFAGTDTFDQKR